MLLWATCLENLVSKVNKLTTKGGTYFMLKHYNESENINDGCDIFILIIKFEVKSSCYQLKFKKYSK